MGRILYYSTNRANPYVEPFKELVTFPEALLMGQAPDGGLFMPSEIPHLSIHEIMGLKGKPYSEAALLVVGAFLREEMSFDKLREIAEESYNFSVPIERVFDRKYVMRLDQGPTSSFKDFAARMLARLMNHFRERGRRKNILVATSGDTGGAIGEAFKGLDGIEVFILYPRDEVSARQRRQLDGIGENVQAISIRGKFDDCQAFVKRAFSDPQLQHLNLGSANSINFGRILPQIVYYVYAYAQLAEDKGERILFSVPSGNFGNALGCEFARRMGLPVERLIMAVNENDEFPRYLETGVYKRISPSRACISNAMNVGHPSNLSRFFDLYGGGVDKDGVVFKYPQLSEMRRWIFSVSVSDEETRRTIKDAYKKYNLLLEPHGAVGWRALEIYLKEEEDFPLCVSLETAHPAKFASEIVNLLQITPTLPKDMEGIDSREGSSVELPAEYEAFRDYLKKRLKS